MPSRSDGKVHSKVSLDPLFRSLLETGGSAIRGEKPVFVVATAAALIAATAVAALVLTRPLPLDPGALLCRKLSTELGERIDDVVLWSHPAFGWYSRRLPGFAWGQVREVPSGSLVVWDSKFGGRRLGTSEAQMRAWGFRSVSEDRESWARVVLWERS